MVERVDSDTYQASHYHESCDYQNEPLFDLIGRWESRDGLTSNLVKELILKPNLKLLGRTV